MAASSSVAAPVLRVWAHEPSVLTTIGRFAQQVNMDEVNRIEKATARIFPYDAEPYWAEAAWRVKSDSLFGLDPDRPWTVEICYPSYTPDWLQHRTFLKGLFPECFFIGIVTHPRHDPLRPQEFLNPPP